MSLDAATSAELTGRERLEALMESPRRPGIVDTLDFDLVEVDDGRVVFEGEPSRKVYNPIGTVHGGLVCTLLDSVAGCAAQTTLPKGMGYTSLEIKVNYLRPVLSSSGKLTAVGTVTKPGRRAAFVDATVVNEDGKLVATASSTLLVFPIE